MKKFKIISLTASIVLVMVFTLSYDVQAAGQKDFYGVWVSKNNSIFLEINKNAFNTTSITSRNYINKKKYSIVKWEKNDNFYMIYILTESNEKIAIPVYIDAYSDMRSGSDEFKKSSPAELKKAISSAEQAKATAEKAKADAKASQSSFTDARDGKKYKTVKIGKQTWMAQNLDYNANGSKCYKNQDANCQKYGRLYNSETDEVCPSGWYLPSNQEWHELSKYVQSIIGCEECDGELLKAAKGWGGHDGTDEFGFAALPGGGGVGNGAPDAPFGVGGNPNDNFSGAGDWGIWWTAGLLSSRNSSEAYVYYGGMGEPSSWMYIGKPILRSVRCLKSNRNILPAPIEVIEKGTFTDTRDKKTYKTVKIGTQTWMAENLNYEAKGSKCYDNKPANCKKYGRLYNWATAKSACPKGWHLPSKSEYEALDGAVGGGETAGKKLKSKSGWEDWEYGINGTDDFDFSLLPGGNGHSDGSFEGVGIGGVWWSASEYEGYSDDAYHRTLRHDYESARWDSHDKSSLLSVRCVQD